MRWAVSWYSLKELVALQFCPCIYHDMADECCMTSNHLRIQVCQAASSKDMEVAIKTVGYSTFWLLVNVWGWFVSMFWLASAGLGSLASVSQCKLVHYQPLRSTTSQKKYDWEAEAEAVEPAAWTWWGINKTKQKKQTWHRTYTDPITRKLKKQHNRNTTQHTQKKACSIATSPTLPSLARSFAKHTSAVSH